MPSAKGKPIKVFAFDLDGTLIDTAPDLGASLGHALGKFGESQPDIADTRRWIGDGAEELARRAHRSSGLNDELFPRMFEDFAAYYGANLFHYSRVFDGVESVLGLLRDRGFELACITNKAQQFSDAIIDESGLRKYLSFVVGGDAVPRKKPHPDGLVQTARHFGVTPEEVVLVGDSEQDQAAARNAGAGFVFARWGYGELGGGSSGGTQQIERMEDLIALLDDASGRMTRETIG